MPSAEILAVLADEVTEAGEVISRCLDRFAEAIDDAAFQEAAAEYTERVQRIGAASEALTLTGLKGVCDFIERNTAQLGPGGVDAERRVLFERWPQLVLGYLKAPLDGVYSRELVELLQRPAWPEPLDAATAQSLEEQLKTLNETDELTPVIARESVALPEDIALDIPEDVNPKLVDAFLSEGPLQAADYSTLIQRVVNGEGWVEELNECRRLVHALKGAGNTVGVRGIANLCHHVEDILEYLVENATPLKGDLGRLLVKVADTLEMMFEALLGTGPVPSDALQVLQAVLDCVNRMDRGDVASIDMAEAGEAPNSVVAASPDGSGAPAGSALRSGSAAEQVEAKVRISVRTLDHLLRNAGELSITSAHVRERIQQTFKAVAELRERHTSLWDRAHDMESFVTTQGIAAGRRQAASTTSGETAAFDPLELDQYNEMHTQVHGFTETIADLQMLMNRLIEGLTAVDTALNQQALITNEMHESLVTARMVAAGNLESRLQRTARQAAEQCGKRAQLRLEGADVRLDDQMMNALVDPLQHLLRNAVDHGLEAPSTRMTLGKPETGQIVLGFTREGNYLLITCRDDGAGLDVERIRTRAISLGLISEEDRLRDEEIARLILRPGFSTAQAVTEVSGRGVGMDIVHTAVARLKGTLDIRTQAGRGTTFVLRVPMSLGITHCLLVVAAGQTYALPSDNLDRIIYDGADRVESGPDGLRYRDEEVTCPVHSLARLVGVPERPDEEGKRRHVILMKDIAGRIAVLVDAVTGGTDLVIKNLGRYLSRVRGLVGASILGDGSVVPILELMDLLDIERSGVQPVAQLDAALATAERTDVLVVDDSLSVRTALSTLLAEEGYAVRTAKDGLEAIDAINERKPAVLLADLEMPRMNGLELTAHIRGNAATRNLPVILVTSRTSEKHRSMARAAGVDEYVTKPYREEDLLDRMRTLLDSSAKAA